MVSLCLNKVHNNVWQHRNYKILMEAGVHGTTAVWFTMKLCGSCATSLVNKIYTAVLSARLQWLLMLPQLLHSSLVLSKVGSCLQLLHGVKEELFLYLSCSGKELLCSIFIACHQETACRKIGVIRHHDQRPYTEVTPQISRTDHWTRMQYSTRWYFAKGNMWECVSCSVAAAFRVIYSWPEQTIWRRM